eukprot:m.51051 g.51051  ORF g.51051 m.51051 type:complete len:241 (+) comp10926_c0_seq1:51-773(+)
MTSNEESEEEFVSSLRSFADLLTFLKEPPTSDDNKYDADTFEGVVNAVLVELEERAEECEGSVQHIDAFRHFFEMTLVSFSFDVEIGAFNCHSESKQVDLSQLLYKLKNRTSIPANIGIEFCPECNNMLYPCESSDGSALLFQCRQCEHKTAPQRDACVYVNHIARQLETTAIWNKDVVSDPTLPHHMRQCRACGEDDAVYFQTNVNRAESSMMLFYVCCNCGEGRMDEHLDDDNVEMAN